MYARIDIGYIEEKKICLDFLKLFIYIGSFIIIEHVVG